MKKYLYFSIAALALVSCSDDEYIGQGAGTGQKENLGNAILFTSSSQGQTRADHYGADAANLLGSRFVVMGTKGATSVATTTVFDNYNVIYDANTAGTTESNTADWEYVNKFVHKYAGDRNISAQTIKYWDYSQAQYDFIAYSTGVTDFANIVYTANPDAANLYVSDITPTSATDATGGGAYKVQGTKDMLKNFYIADLVTVPKSDYGKEVKLVFRNLASKVRVAFYETIPGYSVRDVEFYESGTADTKVTDDVVTLYSSSSNIATAGTYIVYYPTVNSTDPSTDGYQVSDMNKAHVAFTADASGTSTTTAYAALDYVREQASTLESDKKYLGTTSNTATYAGTTADKTYYTVLPNESATALTLRVNYTLVSDDGSGETIKVWGAKAVVPAEYCQWKSNYAYTYIFKISDNTNGATEKLGGAVEGLHPITFDAVVTDSEDGIQETVTTVATPSITTYSPGVQPTANDEYKKNSWIYVMVMQEGSIQAISAEHPCAIYSLDKGATEAEVMDALNMVASNSSGTITGRNGLVLTPGAVDATITAIPGADGNNITITAGNAAVFNPTSAGNYAVVYGVSAGTPTTYNTAVNVATKPDGWPAGYYTDFGCTEAAPSTFAAGLYYQELTNNNNVFAVKVVKVVD